MVNGSEPPATPTTDDVSPTASDDTAIGSERPIVGLQPQPDLPITFCKHCELDVRPINKGQCPRCGRLLRTNYAARKHPVNILRVDQLYQTIVQEYPPATAVEAAIVHRQLALIQEQLESVRCGSVEWARLVSVAQTLRTTLVGRLEKRCISRTDSDTVTTINRIVIDPHHNPLDD